MRLRQMCMGLALLAAIASTGCSNCRLFHRSSACPAPAPAVSAAPPCCGEPAPVVAGPAPAVQSYSIQPPCCNGLQ